jgi:hypothetical protein
MSRRHLQLRASSCRRVARAKTGLPVPRNAVFEVISGQWVHVSRRSAADSLLDRCERHLDLLEADATARDLCKVVWDLISDEPPDQGDDNSDVLLMYGIAKAALLAHLMHPVLPNPNDRA